MDSRELEAGDHPAGAVTIWLDGAPSTRIVRVGEVWFGRGSDVDIDSSNKAMHRRVGRVLPYGTRWFVENTSRSAPIVVGGVTLAAGDDVSLRPGVTGVEIEAGGAQYRVCVEVPELVSEVQRAESGTATELPVTPSLRRAEVRVLAALCAPRLIGERADLVFDIPTDADIARRLVISADSVGEHMRRIYGAFRRVGFTGLDSPRQADGQLRPGHRHGSMRRVLVAHAVGTAVVTAADVADLPPDPAETWPA